MNGVLIVNKPTSWTSRDVVNKLAHIFNTKKIGHTGTLDPLASGVLVVTLGKYTKLNNYLTSSYKEYIAEFKLGILTDTLDITGNVLDKRNIEVSIEKINDTIKSYRKQYLQEVPAYSAVKVNGRKLYEYARNGESIELPKKEVDIKEIETLSNDGENIKIRCIVSKGTYIRSLIRDIGWSLGGYATMTSLCRTKQGDFSLNDACTIDDVIKGKYKLLKIKEILDVEVINLDDILYKKVINGVKLDNVFNKEYVLFMKDEKEIALYRKNNEKYEVLLMVGDSK